MKTKWDERYSVRDYYYGTEPNSFLRDNEGLFFSQAKVLCLAEGEGRNAVFLAKLGCDVTAVDFSSAGVEKLKHLAEEKKVHVKTVLADLREFDFLEQLAFPAPPCFSGLFPSVGGFGNMW